MTARRREKSGSSASVTRRDFLRVGSVGLGALGLGLNGVGAFGGGRSPSERSIIFLLLVGGPSQLETWDPKPDAPADLRGPFGTIETRCPGVRICEHLPQMAARMDRLAIVRSMHHDSAPIHETGYQLLQTGRLGRAGDEQHPHIGSVVARLSGLTIDSAPFVIVPGPIASTGVDIPRGQAAGWLGSAFEPSHLAPETAALYRRVTLADSRRTGANYGPSAFGENCLLACRLVESGVRLVTVNMFDTVFNRVTWDCHGSAPFSTLDDYSREVLPTFDRAFTALIDELERTGRLETTLVVAAGEFGRTPRLNASGGRDHWPGVWSVVLAGGGVRGGQVVGASDAHASAPADRPVTPGDLLASMYHGLGIDPDQSLIRPDGESYRLVDDGAVIHELFVWSHSPVTNWPSNSIIVEGRPVRVDYSSGCRMINHRNNQAQLWRPRVSR
jgi:uncharacterized protein (DUF1501 family)